MRVRKRNRTIAGPEGTIVISAFHSGDWHVTDTLHRSYYGMVQNMEDVVGNPTNPNPCFASKFSKEGGIVTGGADLVWQRVKFNESPASFFASLISLSHLPLKGMPSLASMATEAASRSNPSQPSVNLGVSIAELRELPKLVAKKVRSRKGNSVLESEFGWQQLLGDLRGLLKLPEAIESRKRTIQMLNKNNQLGRTRKVWSDSNSSIQADPGGWDVEWVIGVAVRARRIVHETRGSVQATTNWKPTFPISASDDGEMWKQAARVAAGLDARMLFSTLYELMPWSWLIDYFSNLGDLMSLTNNSVASLSGPVVLSIKTESTRTFSGHYSPKHAGVYCSPFTYRKTDWNRVLVQPGLEFRVPILTHGQVSILNNLVNSFNRF